MNAGIMASGGTTNHEVGHIGSEGAKPGPPVSVDWIRPGILRLVLSPRSRIIEADGAWASARLLALGDGHRVAVLLEVTGVASISREAVSFYSQASTVAAFAILGHSPVDRIIGHSLRGLAAPKCPTNYFEDEQEALAWLAGYC